MSADMLLKTCIGEDQSDEKQTNLSDLSQLILCYEEELQTAFDLDENNISENTETDDYLDWEYEQALQKGLGNSPIYLQGLVEAYEDEMKEHFESKEDRNGRKEAEDIDEDIEVQDYEYEKALNDYHEKLKLDVQLVREYENGLVQNEVDNLYTKKAAGSHEELQWKYHLTSEKAKSGVDIIDLQSRVKLFREEKKIDRNIQEQGER